MRLYSDPSRENDKYSLPDVEIFWEDSLLDANGEELPAGWFYWYCLPGCMPDSEPFGPFETKQEAVENFEELHRR